MNTYRELLRTTWADHLEPRARTAPTVVSTFAGCGGSSLGYSMAGFRELLAIEWDPHAAATFRANFPEVPVIEGDIAAVSVADILTRTGLQVGELDVFDGSPPCQGFSTAGKRVLDDPRNALFLEFVRLLKGLQPRVFVMENVSGLVKGKMRLAFAEIMRALEGAGYVVSTRLCDAQYFGVPQSRQRLIFVGVRKDLKVAPSHPAPTVRRAFTFAEAAEGLPELDEAPALSKFLLKFGRIQPRRLWSSQPALWLRETKSINGSMNTKWASWEDTPGTLLKTWRKWKLGYAGVIHPDRHRYLNSAEVRRLGSFPDAFLFAGDFFDVIARIGNSVPPLFMLAIALHLREEVLATAHRPERKRA